MSNKKLGNYSDENVSNFLQRVTRIKCYDIILYNLILN